MTSVGVTLPEVSVVDSIAPVQRVFEEGRSPRVLAVLSPTHPACIRSVSALKEVLGKCAIDIRVLLVWTPVLATDDSDQLVKATMHMPEAVHFLDRDRLVGRAVATAVCATDAVAWDTYLFYGPDPSWSDLGQPIDWYHGLSHCEWAAPDHSYRPNRREAFRETLAILESP